jgi:hypothetical protein
MHPLKDAQFGAHGRNRKVTIPCIQLIPKVSSSYSKISAARAGRQSLHENKITNTTKRLRVRPQDFEALRKQHRIGQKAADSCIAHIRGSRHSWAMHAGLALEPCCSTVHRGIAPCCPLQAQAACRVSSQLQRAPAWHA